MTETAKERIEEEIKDVNRSLVYSLNKNGRAFNSGKRQGLTIALAHIHNATTLVTSEETVTINKEVYDLLINKVNKQRDQLATAVEALENIRDAEYQFAEGYNYDSDSVIINGEECSPDELQKIAKQALAEIGGEDEH